MEQRCDGIVKVKSSVEYFCGLLQALGITTLSPEHIRKAKFNHPSAAPPLLHALHHLIALVSSSPAPLDFKLVLNNSRVPSPDFTLNGSKAPCHDPEGSSASSSSSERNGNSAHLLVHQKKKSHELKHVSGPRASLASKDFPARLSTFIPSFGNGFLQGSLSDRNSKSKGFTRCGSSFLCDAQLDRKALLNRVATSSSLSSSSSSSFDCIKGKSKHSKISDLDRNLNVNHGAKLCNETRPTTHCHRGRMPIGRTCNTDELSRSIFSYKSSNGEAPRKYGCSHPVLSKHGNGRAPHETLTKMDVVSMPKHDIVSVKSLACMIGPISSMQGDYGAHIHVGSEKSLLQVSSASCTPEQHPIEDANEKLDYVKFYMSQWGYPDNLPFLAIANDTEQSRSLLLAMAWTLARFNVFRRILMWQVEPLMLSRSKAPLPPYPADVSCTSEALKLGKEAEESVRAHVRKLRHSLDSMVDVKVRAAARTQQALMLYGKVTSCIKNLHSLRLCKARLHHELDQLQVENKILHPVKGRPLSQYELHLLHCREDLQMHLDALHAEKVVNEKMRELQRHESLFQEWMESVVDLSIAEGPCSDVFDIGMMDFKQQFFHRQDQEENTCEVSLANQANMPTDASNEGLDMHFSSGKMPQRKSGAETLKQNVLDVYLEPILSRIQLTRSETAAKRRTSSVAEKIQRLKYLAASVNQVLTSTQSRVMLPDALGPVLNDSSQFFVGLQKDEPLHMPRWKRLESSDLSNVKLGPI